jgi:putative ABC transport system substrate-binding protein
MLEQRARFRPVTPQSGEYLREGLRELGYIEGHTIAIEYRWVAGRVDRVPELAAELVRLKVDVIVTITHPVTLAVKNATTTIPIVFTRVNDPVGVGLVPSLARPGANLTGVSLQGLDMIGKRLQLLHDAVPRLSRVAYITDPTQPYSPAYVREVRDKAKVLGLKPVLLLEAHTGGEVEYVLAELARERPQALLVEPNTVLLTQRKRIADVTLTQGLPTMYGERRWMDANGLMSYGPSLPDHFRTAAVYVDKLLKGAKPADLPVQQPTKFEFVINLKTARALGLTIPPSLLGRADEVIQ